MAQVASGAARNVAVATLVPSSTPSTPTSSVATPSAGVPCSPASLASPGSGLGVRMTSREGALHLACFRWPKTGETRWDPRGRRGQCYHCGQAEQVRRNLCVNCRVTAFTLTEADRIPGAVAKAPTAATPRKGTTPKPRAVSVVPPGTNPYATAGGYRYCQGNCSTIPRPLTEFSVKDAKKCDWCLHRQAGGKWPVAKTPQSARSSGIRRTGSALKLRAAGAPRAPRSAAKPPRSLKKASSFSVKRNRDGSCASSSVSADAEPGVPSQSLSGVPQLSAAWAPGASSSGVFGSGTAPARKLASAASFRMNKISTLDAVKEIDCLDDLCFDGDDDATTLTTTPTPATSRPGTGARGSARRNLGLGICGGTAPAVDTSIPPSHNAGMDPLFSGFAFDGNELMSPTAVLAGMSSGRIAGGIFSTTNRGSSSGRGSGMGMGMGMGGEEDDLSGSRRALKRTRTFHTGSRTQARLLPAGSSSAAASGSAAAESAAAGSAPVSAAAVSANNAPTSATNASAGTATTETAASGKARNSTALGRTSSGLSASGFSANGLSASGGEHHHMVHCGGGSGTLPANSKAGDSRGLNTGFAAAGDGSVDRQGHQQHASGESSAAASGRDSGRNTPATATPAVSTPSRSSLVRKSKRLSSSRRKRTPGASPPHSSPGIEVDVVTVHGDDDLGLDGPANAPGGKRGHTTGLQGLGPSTSTSNPLSSPRNGSSTGASVFERICAAASSDPTTSSSSPGTLLARLGISNDASPGAASASPSSVTHSPHQGIITPGSFLNAHVSHDARMGAVGDSSTPGIGRGRSPSGPGGPPAADICVVGRDAGLAGLGGVGGGGDMGPGSPFSDGEPRLLALDDLNLSLFSSPDRDCSHMGGSDPHDDTRSGSALSGATTGTDRFTSCHVNAVSGMIAEGDGKENNLFGVSDDSAHSNSNSNSHSRARPESSPLPGFESGGASLGLGTLPALGGKATSGAMNGKDVVELDRLLDRLLGEEVNFDESFPFMFVEDGDTSFDVMG